MRTKIEIDQVVCTEAENRDKSREKVDGEGEVYRKATYNVYM